MSEARVSYSSRIPIHKNDEVRHRRPREAEKAARVYQAHTHERYCAENWEYDGGEGLH